MSVQLPTANRLQVKVEDGAIQQSPEQMSDSGNAQTFTSGGVRFSLCEKDENGIDRRPAVKPDGVQNGCMVEPAVSGTDNALDVYPGKVWIGNSLVAIAAQSDIAVTRPSAGMKKIVSITISGAGTVAVTDGTEASDFSNSRGAGGGAPYVAVGNVELATIELDSSVAAPLTNDEIIFAPEFSHSPSWRLLPYSASIKFAEPLSLIHAGGTAKNVWITRYDIALTELELISFRPPVSGWEITPASSRRGAFNEGVMVVSLSGNQSDLTRRIDGTIRLFECMPDSAGSRRELFYAAIEIFSDYSTEALLTGKAKLLPLEEPIVETV